MCKILLGVIALLLIVGSVAMMQERTDVAVPDVEDPQVGSGEMSVDTAASEEVAVANELPSVNAAAVRDVSGQGLTKVPSYIFDEISLQELNVSNNLLEGSLPAEVRYLQNLKVLNLSNNQFTGIPAEVGQLTQLEVLDVSNNQLTGLPYELGNLKNLKLLNLRGNAYSELDLRTIQESLPAFTVVQVD